MISKSTASPAHGCWCLGCPKAIEPTTSKTAARHNRNTEMSARGSRTKRHTPQRQFDRHLVDCRWHSASQVASESSREDRNGRTGAWRKHKARLPDVYKWRKAKLCGAVSRAVYRFTDAKRPEYQAGRLQTIRSTWSGRYPSWSAPPVARSPHQRWA